MNDYVSSAPEFSLKEGTYDEVQQVTLTSATGGTIYYTTDGSDPTESSTDTKKLFCFSPKVTQRSVQLLLIKREYQVLFPVQNIPLNFHL